MDIYDVFDPKSSIELVISLLMFIFLKLLILQNHKIKKYNKKIFYLFWILWKWDLTKMRKCQRIQWLFCYFYIFVIVYFNRFFNLILSVSGFIKKMIKSNIRESLRNVHDDHFSSFYESFESDKFL